MAQPFISKMKACKTKPGNGSRKGQNLANGKRTLRSGIGNRYSKVDNGKRKHQTLKNMKEVHNGKDINRTLPNG